MKDSVFVLVSRYGSDLNEPEVFESHKLAFDEMVKQFTIDLKEQNGETEEIEHTIASNRASICLGYEWKEWKITECTIKK